MLTEIVHTENKENKLNINDDTKWFKNTKKR